jgi:P27 family predicted phage terminase small subunit
VLRVAPVGLLTQGDRQIFAQYCQNAARIAELEKIVTDNGYTFLTDKGYVVQRPEIAILRNLQQLQVRICGELGLSPSSRSRIELAPDAPIAETDPAEDLLFGNRRSS